MRIITFEHKNLEHLGVYFDEFVLNIQNAIRHYPGTDIITQQIFPYINDFYTFINSPPTIREDLNRLVNYYSSKLFQHNRSFLERAILVPVEKINFLPPLRNPGKIICVASNYPESAEQNRPEYPTIFLKPASTITGPNMPVLLTEISNAVKCEVELAVVIGKKANSISTENVDEYIFGFTIANDLGDQILESRTSQWTSGKMFDTFTPIGPWITTLDEIPMTANLQLSTYINDRLVQKGETSQMIFKIPEIIGVLSTLTTLYPGDLILTGSPKLLDEEPNPSYTLASGDKITAKIKGLGQLTNIIRKEV